MTDAKIALPTNQLLSFLSDPQHQWFIDHSVAIEMNFGETLNFADEPIKYVYFPITGFISQLAVIKEEQSVEMGLIGSEGMLGATLALGNKYAPMTSMVQGDGSALRMNAGLFCERLISSQPLTKLIQEYLYVGIQQLAQTGACNSFHEVQQRLSRWILMTDDRTHSGSLQLTHEFLAKMLGVRRSAVTIAAGSLQQQGLISYSRGHIKVLSRSGLEKVVCRCYFAALNSYQRNLNS